MKIHDNKVCCNSIELTITAPDSKNSSLEWRRAQLIAAMRGYSDELYSANWLDNLDRVLHQQGGIWQILGLAIGWPLGYQGRDGWVTWEEAEIFYRRRNA